MRRKIGQDLKFDGLGFGEENPNFEIELSSVEDSMDWSGMMEAEVGVSSQKPSRSSS